MARLFFGDEGSARTPVNRVRVKGIGGRKPKRPAGTGLNSSRAIWYLNRAFLTIIRMPDYNESGIFTGVLRMNIDLSWLRHHPKDLEVFNLEKQYGDLEIAKDVHLLDRVAVELEVTNTGRLMVGKGEIRATLELQCDRCLKPFRRRVKLPFNVEFCPEENRSFFKDEETFVYFTEPQVDIEPVVLESIVLSLPLRALCSPDCKGLCYMCGQELNLAECNCQEKEIDPRWEALKKILNGEGG